jgi:hypothetical protein
VQATAHSRVDFVALGDSNQAFGGTGWDQGFALALLARGAQMYATQLLTPRENAGNGAGLGYLYNAKVNGTSGAASTGAPAAIQEVFAFSSPHNYLYGESGTVLAFGQASGGILLNATCPLNVDANLDWEFHYGTFDSGSGEFRIGIRRDDSPFSGLATSALTSTNTGNIGVTKVTVQLAAATRGYPLNGGFAMTNTGSVNVTGPFCGGWVRVINTDRTAGFSYHSMRAAGGESLRDYLRALQEDWTDTSIAYYLQQMRTHQGSRKRICVMVNSGVNDRSETETSLGPQPVADGDSADAYADNLRGIINKIRGVWVTQGWPIAELVFIVSPSHPVSAPNDAELESYLVAAQQVATEYDCVCVVPFQELTNFAEMDGQSWYASGADRNHLSANGYTALATKALGY